MSPQGNMIHGKHGSGSGAKTNNSSAVSQRLQPGAGAVGVGRGGGRPTGGSGREQRGGRGVGRRGGRPTGRSGGEQRGGRGTETSKRPPGPHHHHLSPRHEVEVGNGSPAIEPDGIPAVEEHAER